MAVKSVWVICISYDYGVVGNAGCFSSEAAADKWIEEDHARDAVLDAEIKDDWDEVIDGAWEDPTPTEYYTVELKLNE